MTHYRKLLLLILSLLFLLTGSNALGEVKMDSPEVDSIIFTGIRLVYADSTLAAVDEFKKLIDLFPDKPIGYFYSCAALHNMMDDHRNYTYQNEFNRYLNQAIKAGEDGKKKGNLTAYDYLYFGGAIGFRGIHKALTGDWMGGFVDGLKGRNNLVKALEIDSTLYDVYYGLGSYHFWRSLKSKSFWWLPFIADNRQKGIEMIKLVIEKSKYAKKDAELALVRIWVENKEYNNAFNMIDKLSKIYPNKPYLLWLYGRVQFETDNDSGAIKTYHDLLKALAASPYYDPTGEVECRYDLAQAYYCKGDFRNCSAQIDTIFTFQKYSDKDKSIKDFIHQAGDLKNKIKKGSKGG